MIRVFIGYEPRQPIAHAVAAHSIWSRASGPVSITRLQLSQLPIRRRGLTEFTYSRFLVPWLCGFEGYAIFVDSDVVCLGDVGELIEHAEAQPEADVCVVQGPMRFEWPSLMVFNNARCRILTPEYIEDTAHGMFDLKWADKVGALTLDWNHLVGYSQAQERLSLIHYTAGIPIWPETQGCEHAAIWHKEYRRMSASVDFNDLMGRSVHKRVGA